MGTILETKKQPTEEQKEYIQFWSRFDDHEGAKAEFSIWVRIENQRILR